ncbi:hypothetical protein OIU77_015140 [Salix suchowensis]|uniref:Uncharacterized protein n=1 Tax=Salix suchowensis TaxID=1278906 RepID=A0ABQ8ZSF2_9ROSI|nr:hypothetical protein OIU77_015140 [Salix suchowensis]
MHSIYTCRGRGRGRGIAPTGPNQSFKHCASSEDGSSLPIKLLSKATITTLSFTPPSPSTPPPSPLPPPPPPPPPPPRKLRASR